MKKIEKIFIIIDQVVHDIDLTDIEKAAKELSVVTPYSFDQCCEIITSAKMHFEYTGVDKLRMVDLRSELENIKIKERYDIEDFHVKKPHQDRNYQKYCRKSKW